MKVVHIGPKNVHIGHGLVQTTPKMKFNDKPTLFLGYFEPKYVQCGYVLVQYGQLSSLHLLSYYGKIRKMYNSEQVDSKCKLKTCPYWTKTYPHWT